jgi:hypothetical protein
MDNGPLYGRSEDLGGTYGVVARRSPWIIPGFTDTLFGCTLDYGVIELPAGGGHASGSGRSHLG